MKSAFPVIDIDPETDMLACCDSGMTLRDYFAAKALQGLLSGNGIEWDDELLVDSAYKLADAMMKERGE